jgi:NTP pyrophosphatase (non-canonical NTP hydrolase)
MTDLPKLQKQIYENKLAKGFNVTDIYMEFCYTHGELSEAFEAYAKKKNNVGEELADVAIYLLGLAEILGINLEKEILSKVEKNEQRKYVKKDGVVTRVGE